jgi:uncharacterized membrane protein YjjP (DUF1212 family)
VELNGESGTTTTSAIDEAKLNELVLRFARAAHRSGFPSDDLERRVEELGAALGRKVSVSATPTLLEVAIGQFPRQRTSTIRVTPQPVDLFLIGRLDDLASNVRHHRLEVPAALTELGDLQPLHRPAWVVIGAYALAGGAVTPVLSGGWREAVAAVLAGILVGVVAVVGSRRANTQAIVAPVAAIAASLGCIVLAQLGFEVSIEIATLGSLVAVLPGMTLTIGMRELATSHLQSGVANSAIAFVQLVGLVFGAAVGTSIAMSWFGSVPSSSPSSFGLETQIGSAALAGVAFTVTLNAHHRDAVWAAGSAVLAIVADALAEPLIGKQAAVFAAALAVGLAGNAFALWRSRSALIVIVPGILMLVPGSLGYESAASLLGNNTVAGVDAAFDTLVVALSIVYGLIVSAALLPDRPRRARAQSDEGAG